MRAAIFIDGAYLLKQLADVGVAPDYSRLAEYLLAPLVKRAPVDLMRCYFYDCSPWSAERPTEAEKRRLASYDAFVAVLHGLDRWEVRLGKLERRRDGEKETYTQKRVDVQLSVDLVRHAAGGHVQHVVIVAGDSDFIPAIVAAKEAGVTVTLACDKDKSVHKDLLVHADEVHFLDWKTFPTAAPGSTVAARPAAAGRGRTPRGRGRAATPPAEGAAGAAPVAAAEAEAAPVEQAPRGRGAASGGGRGQSTGGGQAAAGGRTQSAGGEQAATGGGQAAAGGRTQSAGGGPAAAGGRTSAGGRQPRQRTQPQAQPPRAQPQAQPPRQRSQPQAQEPAPPPASDEHAPPDGGEGAPAAEGGGKRRRRRRGGRGRGGKGKGGGGAAPA